MVVHNGTFKKMFIGIQYGVLRSDDLGLKAFVAI